MKIFINNRYIDKIAQITDYLVAVGDYRKVVVYTHTKDTQVFQELDDNLTNAEVSTIINTVNNIIAEE